MQFRAPKKGKIAPARYPFFPHEEEHWGEVVGLLNERGRSAPLAQIRFDDGRVSYLPAVVGMHVGSRIRVGSKAEVKPGNILPLAGVPDGANICNIEIDFGDGGKLVRASGASAILFSKTPSGAVVKFPSGRSAIINPNSRAMIGEVAGGGRTEKPFLRAGAKFHLMRAKGKLYPRARGVAMPSVHHPFGGGRHQHPGKSTSTSRHAPPGRKVGMIASRKTGRKRIARKFIVKVRGRG